MTSQHGGQESLGNVRMALRGRPLFTLALLSAAYLLALVDRNVLTVLIEPMKRDLAISDTQFGLLQGAAFAVFYIALAVPLATLSDRWNRRNVIVGGLVVWSVSTCCAGMARSFGALFAARIGVGAGEGCLAPAAYSIFADQFDRRVLGRVIGLFHALGGLGIGGASILGGLLYQHFASQGAASGLTGKLPAWGSTLITVGAPGVVLALVILLLVREPARRAQARSNAIASAEERELTVFGALLARNGILARLLVGNAFLAIAGTALLTWAPAYLMRVFELNPGEAGVRMGVAATVSALLGPLAGGAMSDALFKRYGDRGPFAALVALAVWLIVGYAFMPFAPNANIVALLVALIGAGYMAALSVLATTLQLQTPPPLRARVSAVWLCLNTLIGLGLGAFLVGFVNDRVFATPNAVGTSLGLVATLSCAVGGAIIASVLFRSLEPRAAS
jgi:MFS family permease